MNITQRYIHLNRPLIPILFVLLLLFAVLPFLILCYFTVPNLEDYAESIIPNVWWHVKFLYLTYDGRYFSSFLFAAFNPLKWGSYALYKIIPIFLFLGLFTSIHKFSKTFLETNRSLHLFITILVFILFLNRNPNISYSFYYMISSYVYMVTTILFFWFVSESYSCIKRKKGVGFIKLIVLCMLIFAIAGGNELLLIPMLLWVCFLFYYNGQNKLNAGKEISLFFLSIFCSYFIVFTSPGTQNFLDEQAVNKNFTYLVESLLLSTNFSSIFIFSWIKGNYTLLLSSLVFLVLLNAKQDKFKQKKRTCLSLSTHFLAFGLVQLFLTLPYTWAAGSKASISYTQIFIIPYLFFLVFWFYSIYLCWPYLTQIFKWKSQKLLLLLILGMFLGVFIDPNSRIMVAYQDVFSGEAKNYHAEVVSNIKKSELATEESTDVAICTLNFFPETIFSGVYFNQENEEFHLEYRLFYNIKQLRISECP